MDPAPNILLITTDEERFNLPRPAGFSLPARERIAESGTAFTRYYAASTQCSSSRSVIYTGQHLPITQIYDNDNMPYVRPLDPSLGTLGTMLRSQGYSCTYQGKWHLSNAYVDPANLTPGDLVFFENTYTWGLSHVGIYIGDGQFVHAGSERTGVVISDLWDDYWGSRYYSARHVRS